MRVLFLDDDPNRHEAFKRHLASGHEVTYTWSVGDALLALEGQRFELAALDHDLGGRVYVSSDDPSTGFAVARAIARMPRELRPERVILHSHNAEGASRMAAELVDAGVPVLVSPFGFWSL